MRTVLLIAAAVSPLVLSTLYMDGQATANHQGFDSPNARRSQNVEIAPNDSSLSQAEISPNSNALIPSEPASESFPAQEKQFNPAPLDESRGSGRLQVTIQACNGKPGHANFWAGDQTVGIISSGTVVELTGKESGEWVEAIAVYWPNDKTIQQTGKFWIHRCWT